jgi:hypothetical protein
MKVGIVSDTHGKAKRLAAALEALERRDVEAIVHCGDLGTVECLEMLASAGVPAYAVAGNMDRHAGDLEAVARQCGVAFGVESVEIVLPDDRCIGVTHGHFEGVLREMIESGRCAYVCTGHTHRPADTRVGEVRVINPGALRCARGRQGKTIAILDTDADTVEFIALH